MNEQKLQQHMQKFATETADYRELIDQIFQRDQGADSSSVTLNEAINQILLGHACNGQFYTARVL